MCKFKFSAWTGTLKTIQQQSNFSKVQPQNNHAVNSVIRHYIQKLSKSVTSYFFSLTDLHTSKMDKVKTLDIDVDVSGCEQLYDYGLAQVHDRPSDGQWDLSCFR